MSEKKRIVELLEKETLNSVGVSERLGIKLDSVYVYLSVLESEKKIVKITDKRPHKYISITPEALMKRVYSIMLNKMRPKEKLSEFELKYTMNKVEELM